MKYEVVRCKSTNCNQDIVFCVTKNKKKMPVNVESFNPDECEYEMTELWGEMPVYINKVHIPHFTNCPSVKAFRK